MELILMFVLGAIFGGIVAATTAHKRAIGNLRIDSSDPDGPYMFLELAANVDHVRRERYITLKVVDKDYTRN